MWDRSVARARALAILMVAVLACGAAYAARLAARPADIDGEGGRPAVPAGPIEARADPAALPAFYIPPSVPGTSGGRAPRLIAPGPSAGMMSGVTGGIPGGPRVRAVFAPARADSPVDCLTSAIYYEAASEPTAGQEAVAQVVLNRVRQPGYPKSVCGVVYQGSERRTGCQFTFTCDGSLARAPSAHGWDRARMVAERALAGEVAATLPHATHYHANYVNPYWSASLRRLGQIGRHIFYALPFGRPGPGQAFARTSGATRAGQDLAGQDPPAARAQSPDARGLTVWGLRITRAAP